MEVILRKTKITKSILDQTYQATEDELKNSEVLGWCLKSTAKYNVAYILLYDAEEFSLSKYKFPAKIEKEYHDRYTSRDGSVTPEIWKATVKYNGNWSETRYVWKSEKDQTDFVENLKRVEQEARDYGQIFI